MKNFLFSAATLIFLLSSWAPLSAQTTATWKGNKPGQPNEWNCPANWREGRVPNEFSQVVIPSGVAIYPVIKGPVTPIDALLVESGASLTLLQTGQLSILNETSRFDGILILGSLQNMGLLEIKNMRRGSLAIAQK